jgi:hypothetical protein
MLPMWFWLFYVAGLFFCLWHSFTPSQPYPRRSGAWTTRDGPDRHCCWFVTAVLSIQKRLRAVSRAVKELI